MAYEKRFCAHRGLSALTPENTLPAFSAALALGADEIEFDVRLTKDAQLIVSHDNTLERISDGSGKLRDHTLSELRGLNIGIKHGWQVGFCTPEEVFSLLANKIRFNIHLKEHGEEGYLMQLPDELFETAKIRLEYPSSSLSELALKHTPPISKSGLTHRLAKIMDFAEEKGIVIENK